MNNIIEMDCWVCGQKNFSSVGGSTRLALRPEDFKITDAHYGHTLPRYRCKNCGFIQCDIGDVTSYYEQLTDIEYIESSSQRALQFSRLLKSVEPYIKAGGRYWI